MGKDDSQSPDSEIHGFAIKSIAHILEKAGINLLQNSEVQIKLCIFIVAAVLLYSIICITTILINPTRLDFFFLIVLFGPDLILLYLFNIVLNPKDYKLIFEGEYIDLQNYDFSEICEELKRIRSLFCEQINKTCSTKDSQFIPITLDNIRANVWIPDFLTGYQGENIFKLFMPNELRINMDLPAENSMRLWPGQGNCGRTFLNNQTCVIFKDSFHREIVYPDLIHKDLKWIVSFPVKRKRGLKNVFAVVGLDCINRECDPEVINTLANDFDDNLKKIKSLLNNCNKKKVSFYKTITNN